MNTDACEGNKIILISISNIPLRVHDGLFGACCTLVPAGCNSEHPSWNFEVELPEKRFSERWAGRCMDGRRHQHRIQHEEHDLPIV